MPLYITGEFLCSDSDSLQGSHLNIPVSAADASSLFYANEEDNNAEPSGSLWSAIGSC